ncbi:MAG: VWA domain-containing protein [Pyrinomonadaceae bacterium]
MFHTRFSKPLPAISVSLFCAALLFLAPFFFARAAAPQGTNNDALATDASDVRADLPLGGELRVENVRGGISVEVWNEKFVSVTATIENANSKTASRVSLVRIERTDELLTVNVARAATLAANKTRVNLSLRIPERARAEIINANGEVRVRGVPETLSVRTVSGNIRAESSAASLNDSDIMARSVSGTAINTLALADKLGAPASAKFFHVRLGNGSKLVRLRSERGRITLASTDTTNDTAAANNRSNNKSGDVDTSARRSAQTPPVLRGARKNASTPVSNTTAVDPSAPQEVDENDVIRVDTQLVTINASVVDRSTNRGLAGLTQNDFKLYEDNAPQEIRNFESNAAPFNLVLLIDLSGSTKEIVNLIRGAALRFVAAARPADRIAVITFAAAPVVVSELTADRNLLRRRIDAIEQPRGSTKLYDALDFTMNEVLKNAKDSRRNAIVLMSDGLDSSLPNVKGAGSTLSYKELLHNAQEFDGVIYSLWLNTEYESLSTEDIQPETFDLAHDRVKELAEVGGGVFYEVEKLDDLAGAYERVVADLGTVYSFAYRPTNKTRDGGWRSVRLTVERPNAVARGKRGYYAN